MSDRELLELAAKAAGLRWRYCEATGAMSAYTLQDGYYGPSWNPLTDDGDALRLAVKLNLKFVFHPALNQALVRPYYASDAEWVENGENHADPCAATRRAIVRAAAEIGKAAS